MRPRKIDHRFYQLISHQHNKSVLTEEYRTIRTNIQFASFEQEVKTILVTSTNPNEGKSLTCINLAIIFATDNKRILYVDTDMRKPTGHKMLKLVNVHGISSYLAGQKSIEEIIQPTHINNLSIITAGPIPPNPAEMLGSSKMKEFIAEIRPHFDLIFFDSPPILAVTDAPILAKQLDASIMVIHAKKTDRSLAQQAKKKLETANPRILGAILNNKKAKMRKSYYTYLNE